MQERSNGVDAYGQRRTCVTIKASWRSGKTGSQEFFLKSTLYLTKLALFLAVVTTSTVLHAADPGDVARWKQEAQRVTIIRDDWGIAHVYGKTDADAVFGMEYAQAEDEFNRVETNYVNAMGRLAETEGKYRIYQDLRMKLFIDPVAMKTRYAASPAWLKGDALVRRWPELLPREAP